MSHETNEETTTAGYANALAAARAAAAEFRAAQLAYRARRIGDAAFLAAKAKYDQSEVEFSAARGELPEAA